MKTFTQWATDHGVKRDENNTVAVTSAELDNLVEEYTTEMLHDDLYTVRCVEQMLKLGLSIGQFGIEARRDRGDSFVVSEDSGAYCRTPSAFAAAADFLFRVRREVEKKVDADR